MKKSLEEMRATKHVSASAIKSFLMCPKKFEFQYVLGPNPSSGRPRCCSVVPSMRRSPCITGR